MAEALSVLTYTGEAAPPCFNMAQYCLARAAAAMPGKVGLIVVGDADAPIAQAEQWTYGALDDAVRRIGAGLRASGLSPGDRVMIRMPNTSDYALFFFGAIAAGIVPLPVSAQLTGPEVAFLLADSSVSAVVTLAEFDRTPIPAGVRHLDSAAVSAIKAAAPLAGYADTAANDPAFMIYTSGTGSRPKGVVHAQRNAWGRRPMYRDWYGIGADDVMLHSGAFNWSYTLGVALTDPWANGATTVLYNGPKDIQVWPKLIAAAGATMFASVPTLYRQILKYCDLAPARIGRLRRCLAAGEALSPAVLSEWQGATGLAIYEAFGMSECSTFVSNRPDEPVRPGSPGKAQTGRCIGILSVSGAAEPLPPGEVGLLAIHRADPGLMLGYWNRPEEDAVALRGDWFASGDLASIDPAGYVWFHGRADDVMNPGGFRVSPVEVEAALADHPAIAEVAVAERQVREGVTIIAAYVVPKIATGAASGPDLVASILDHAATRLASYKRPREVIFVDALPRSANGKVQRRRLADLAPGAAPAS